MTPILDYFTMARQENDDHHRHLRHHLHVLHHHEQHAEHHDETLSHQQDHRRHEQRIEQLENKKNVQCTTTTAISTAAALSTTQLQQNSPSSSILISCTSSLSSSVFLTPPYPSSPEEDSFPTTEESSLNNSVGFLPTIQEEDEEDEESSSEETDDEDDDDRRTDDEHKRDRVDVEAFAAAFDVRGFEAVIPKEDNNNNDVNGVKGESERPDEGKEKRGKGNLFKILLDSWKRRIADASSSSTDPDNINKRKSTETFNCPFTRLLFSSSQRDFPTLPPFSSPLMPSFFICERSCFSNQRVSSFSGYLLFQSRFFIALFYGKKETKISRTNACRNSHMKQYDYLPFILLVRLSFLYINKQRDRHGVWPASYGNPKKSTTEVS